MTLNYSYQILFHDSFSASLCDNEQYNVYFCCNVYFFFFWRLTENQF